MDRCVPSRPFLQLLEQSSTSNEVKWCPKGGHCSRGVFFWILFFQVVLAARLNWTFSHLNHSSSPSEETRVFDFFPYYSSCIILRERRFYIDFIGLGSNINQRRLEAAVKVLGNKLKLVDLYFRIIVQIKVSISNFMQYELAIMYEASCITMNTK